MLDRVKGTRKSSADEVCGADATCVKLDRTAAGLEQLRQTKNRQGLQFLLDMVRVNRTVKLACVRVCDYHPGHTLCGFGVDAYPTSQSLVTGVLTGF